MTSKVKIQLCAGSYRTSIPKPIAKLLNVKEGDSIEYSIKKHGDIVVKKIEK